MVCFFDPTLCFMVHLPVASVFTLPTRFHGPFPSLRSTVTTTFANPGLAVPDTVTLALRLADFGAAILTVPAMVIFLVLVFIDPFEFAAVIRKSCFPAGGPTQTIDQEPFSFVVAEETVFHLLPDFLCNFTVAPSCAGETLPLKL
jgi:hypothetical protein